MYKNNWLFWPALIALVFLMQAGTLNGETGLINQPLQTVKKYGVFELNMKAANPGSNPYVDGPEVFAVFTGPNSETYTVNGYWDGNDGFSIRFSPQSAGEWRYKTTSSDKGLNGIEGSFMAVNPTKNELKSNILNHGFLKAHGYGWTLTDGIPFLPVGETQWSFTEEFHDDEWKEWVKALNQRGYNSFLGCIWLALYNRAGILPFNGSPHDDMLNESFFDRLDEWVEFANSHGIIMGLTIGGFPDNSKWFSLFNTRERNDRWFKYCVRRYAAHNVRWVMYGEVDEVNPSWASWEQNAEATAKLIREEDPYDHPIGSHHRYIDRATARSENIDFLCIQSNRNAFGRMGAENQYLTTVDYRQYGKPLWFEEYWYENKEGLMLGIQNTYRNFIAGMAFPTMGSLMRGHEIENVFVPALAKKNDQGVFEFLMESDTGMQCMQYFGDFFDDLDILDFSPASEKIKDAGLKKQCGLFGNKYVIYLEQGGTVSLDLTDATGKFKIEKMEILTGKREKLAPIKAGGWQVIDSKTTNDVVLTVYGGKIPKPMTINSPLRDSEFKPGEKVYVHAAGTKIQSTATYAGKEIQKSSAIGTLSFDFNIPIDAPENQKLKLQFTDGHKTIEQTHNVSKERTNIAPQITRTSAVVFSGETVGIQLAFSDSDGPGPYVFRILESPQHGTLSGTGNDRLYTPHPQFEGTDRFVWTVNDGIYDAPKPAVVTIIVKKK